MDADSTQTALHIGRKQKEVRGCDYNYLRDQKSVVDKQPQKAPPLSIVDLFSGVGGLSLGICEAAQSMGHVPMVSFACDMDSLALDCFRLNLPTSACSSEDIQRVFSARPTGATTSAERRLLQACPSVDFLVGGPPCQGHSDLNNYSRRKDEKNSLYLYMARAAKVLSPKYVIIENVPGAIHDKGGAVQNAADLLAASGYHVELGTVDCLKIGVPQRRKRLILIGSRVSSPPSVSSIVEAFGLPDRDLRWAIGDLNPSSSGLMDEPSRPNKTTAARIDFLFDHNLYDLPDEQRPPCHSNRSHTYNSVYGRLHWERPAQTITSGFYCMCMGRYVHPDRRRTLTAHEAARLQFLPDSFRFPSGASRTNLATMIGNVVPPKVGYVLASALLQRGDNG
jgi:DNA (cytosine-5)-methyltransferase 1